MTATRFQFSLRKMLLWTVVWAIYLGILRATGTGFYSIIGLTVYLAGIVGVYARWGLAEGFSITMMMSSVYWTCFVLANTMLLYLLGVLEPENLLIALFATPILLLAGFVPGFISVVLVHWLVSFVNWVDGTFQSKPQPPDLDASFPP